MPKTDPRVDQYINKSADFARPILNHLRKLVHKACPEIEETMKWSFPHFEYKGNVCNMASFKNHCTFGFWKASLMKDNKDFFEPIGETAMGHFGKITSLKELPSDKDIIAYIKEAVKLNEDGVKIPTKPKKKAVELEVPEILEKMLSKSKKAKSIFFDEFSTSHRKEYIEWINEAKTDATKNKRAETAVEWISEGKQRHWKYAKK